MRKFWKDYGKLWKDTGKFWKEHWFGVIILNIVLTILWFSPTIVDKIKDKIEMKSESKTE